MADDQQTLPRISGDLALVGRHDPALKRLQRLAARWPGRNRITLEGGESVGLERADFLV